MLALFDFSLCWLLDGFNHLLFWLFTLFTYFLFVILLRGSFFLNPMLIYHFYPTDWPNIQFPYANRLPRELCVLFYLFFWFHFGPWTRWSWLLQGTGGTVVGLKFKVKPTTRKGHKQWTQKTNKKPKNSHLQDVVRQGGLQTNDAAINQWLMDWKRPKKIWCILWERFPKKIESHLGKIFLYIS